VRFANVFFLVLTVILQTSLAEENALAKGALTQNTTLDVMIRGTTSVSAEHFIKLVNTNPNLVVMDARIQSDRKQGYIESSISLPDIDTNCERLAKHIPSHDSPAVFYCNGIKCNRSANAIKIAVNCGYRNTYWFRGGFAEWLAKGYPYLRE